MNLTLVDNTAGSTGGGIYLTTNSQLNLLNSILWNNNPKEVFFDMDNEANSVTISYCDIQGGQDSISTNHNGEVHWLEGNIEQDPLFVNSGNHPCQINDNSPCINAGADTAGLNLPEFDLAGEIRIFNEIVDMGAYEWNTFVGLEEFEIQSTKSKVLSYPNPFTTSTTIEYELNQPKNVTIIFYNQFGKQVDVFEESQQKGLNKVVWSPEKLANGIYYFRIETSDYVTGGKTILLK